VRDLAHEKVFAKALESLGVNWGKTLPVPKADSSKMPEVRELEKRNLHNQQWTFSNEPSHLRYLTGALHSEMAKLKHLMDFRKDLRSHKHQKLHRSILLDWTAR
jgi:Mn-containing catalase